MQQHYAWMSEFLALLVNFMAAFHSPKISKNKVNQKLFDLDQLHSFVKIKIW